MATKGHNDSPLVVDGIKVDLTVESVDDYEITEALVDMSDEALGEQERARATVAMARLLFGADWTRIKRELRERHDGKLTNETVGEFIKTTFETLNRKNS